MTADRMRWVAVILAILSGAVLVGMGIVDGNAWLASLGGILAGGATVKALP